MTSSPTATRSQQIEEIARELEIDRIGFASLSSGVGPLHREKYSKWLEEGHHAQMEYLSKYNDLRYDPRGLLPEAKSIIVIAVSYYPTELQAPTAPQISKYAYGRDYHKVMRSLLEKLADRITTQVAPHTYRACVDTAPIMERYWAQRAGIGFVGKSKMLIAPRVGSYLFLGELLTSLELEETPPLQQRCGQCTRCIDACPTGALSQDHLRAERCLSYLTIEHREEIPLPLASKLGLRLYGCDTCQDVCPYNHRPLPTRHFTASREILSLSYEKLSPFTPERYAQIFHGTAATRAKWEGMRRNVEIFYRNNPLPASPPCPPEESEE